MEGSTRQLPNFHRTVQLQIQMQTLLTERHGYRSAAEFECECSFESVVVRRGSSIIADFQLGIEILLHNYSNQSSFLRATREPFIERFTAEEQRWASVPGDTG